MAIVELDLNDEEREILIAVLESYLSDLRMEIADTDSLDVRTYLKVRKEVLRKVLAVLRGQSEAGAAGP